MSTAVVQPAAIPLSENEVIQPFFSQPTALNNQLNQINKMNMCKDNKLTIKHQRNLKQCRSIAYSIDFQPNQDTTTFNLDKSVLQPRKLLQKLTEIFFTMSAASLK